MQQGDVLLCQTNDDGDIEVIDGLVTMTGTFSTAAYLALFGGNEDDTGLSGSAETWWGNLSENEPARRYVSETQNLLQSIPPTSNNLLRIEDAAKRDLSFFLTGSIASSVEVSAALSGVNQVKIIIDISAEGEESSFEFTENWRATS